MVAMPPRAASACRRAASLVDPELLENLLVAHGVEVVRNLELRFEKAQPIRNGWLRWFQCFDLDQGLARFGDDEGLPIERRLDEAGQMGLRFMDVHGFHRASDISQDLSVGLSRLLQSPGASNMMRICIKADAGGRHENYRDDRRRPL